MAGATTIGEGRIRFRLSVGITGHRRLADSDGVATRLHAALDELTQRFAPTDATEVRFEVLSALAEGADRLLVHEAYATIDSTRLELHVVLPLAVADYMRDFALERSKSEFHDLLAQATRETVMAPAETREEAYEMAGRFIVDHSDVVIAVWDGDPPGGRGGTAAIVEYARSHSVPVVMVPASRGSGGPTPPPPTEPEPPEGDGLRTADEAYARTVEFNRGSTTTSALEGQIDKERARLAKAAHSSSLESSLDAVVAWGLPRFVRADALATRYQRWHYRLGMTLYLSAALAVTAVAAQALGNWNRKLALIETGFMVLLLTVYVLARQLDFHERWLGYRSLAEAFRSALFIAMVKPPDAPAGADVASRGPRRQPWFQRTFSEAWADRPAVRADPARAEDLWGFLVQGWIDDQLKYHARAQVRLRGDHRRLNITVFTLFALTVVVGLFHVFDVFGETVSTNLLVFLAVTLPAFGAGLTGIRDQHQYLVHEERSARTAGRLEALRRREPRDSLGAVQQLAADVQAAVEAERSDWWTVSELQRVEMLI
jgi:hypothetical protein